MGVVEVVFGDGELCANLEICCRYDVVGETTPMNGVRFFFTYICNKLSRAARRYIMVHHFIKDRVPELSNIFRKHNVKRAYLFGSACTDMFHENSDVDILIEPGDEPDPVIKGETLWNLYFTLQDFLNRKVDIVTRESMKNKYFIEEVNRTSELIYG